MASGIAFTMGKSAAEQPAHPSSGQEKMICWPKTGNVVCRPVAKDTIITFKVDKAFKAKLAVLAAAENRSLSNFIEMVLKTELAKRGAKIEGKKVADK